MDRTSLSPFRIYCDLSWSIARAINEICDEAGTLVNKGPLKRFIRQNDQRAAIDALLSKLDHAWRVFDVSVALCSSYVLTRCCLIILLDHVQCSARASATSAVAQTQ